MTTAVQSKPASTGGSPWAPFRSTVFTVVWTATLIGNIGTWVRDVGAGWLMTSISTSSTQVALVQVATTLPIFLLSLPAGALADIINRRAFLLWVNVVLVAVAVAMGLATQANAMTPGLLIAFLLVGGVCTALAQPMQQSLAPLLVPRPDLRSAVALNSLGFNVARAIGPAIAGVIIAASSVAINFYVDAATYVAVILAFWWWKGAAKPAAEGQPENLLPAMAAGMRYAIHSGTLQRTLVRSASYFIYASAVWALLPVIARVQLGGGPAYYGILMSCVGGGAVAGAVLLPKLRGKFGTEGIMRSGMVITIAALLALALVKDQVLAAVSMAVMGMAWISILTTANVAAQTALPDWVRGRGLAIYLTVFYGAMTAGSLIWGAVADTAGVPVSLLAAAGVGMASLALAFLKPLPERELDLTPSMHWPEPAVSTEVLKEGEADRGPVLITVEYLVAPERAPEFLAALREFKPERLRDGAFQWGVFEDTAQPGRYIEHFLVASWLEHQRQHRRVSKADAELQAQVSRFHRGDGPPKVEHFIAPRTAFPAS